MGQADVVFHGQHPHHDHADEAGNDGYLDAQAAPHAELIDQSADDAGNGVDLFSEDEGYLVDEHVAHHSTGSSRYASHHDGHPEGLPHEERLLYAGNGEQGQSEGIEDEPRVIESHQPFAEDDGDDEGKGRTYQIDGIGHPERSEPQHDIAECAAADGCSQSHYIAAKPVELFGGSQTGARDGKGERSEELDDELYGVQVFL